MRTLLGLSDDRLRSVLDPRRFIRWIYVGRLSLATAIFVAAVFVWQRADWESTLIPSLTLVLAVLFTAWSAWHTSVTRAALTRTFLYGQGVFDVLVVTAVVHVTGRQELSFFAALYVIVNMTAAFLLPVGGSLLLAVFGAALYAADVFWWSSAPFSVALLMQVLVFIAVALATSAIGSRLQQIGASSRQLAAALDQARLEAADILGNIRSGILTVDGSGRLLYANSAASDLLGFDLLLLTGQAVLEDIRRVAPGLATAFERAVIHRVNTQREEAHVSLAHREFPIGITTTSNDGDGARVGRSITAIFQDISDQKRVDQLRRRAERLEAVAELSASLAHEIRNPLASIRSAVEQLGDSPRATADERTLSRLIVRESDRLSRLLAEFLDFARTRVTRLGTVDLGAIARGAANLAAAHPSKPPGVEVECVVPTTPVTIEGDEDLLHRAVFNLALNAVQAARGRVRVEVIMSPQDALLGGVRFDQGVVALRVTDDGAGIDPGIRDRIFHPFATTKPGGSGLGLAVAHRAVEAHRGVVLVDSDATGTRFTVLLPVAQPQPAPVGALP